MSSFSKVWPGPPTMDHVDQDRICMEDKSLADFTVPWLSCLVSTISWVVESRNLLCSHLTEVQSVSLKEEGVTLRSPTPASVAFVFEHPFPAYQVFFWIPHCYSHTHHPFEGLMAKSDLFFMARLKADPNPYLSSWSFPLQTWCQCVPEPSQPLREHFRVNKSKYQEDIYSHWPSSQFPWLAL